MSTTKAKLLNLIPQGEDAIDETIIEHLVSVLEDQNSSVEETEDLAVPYFIELKIAKDEEEAKNLLQSLSSSKTEAATSKKLDVPINLHSLERDIPQRKVDLGNTWDAVLSLEPDVDTPKTCVPIEEFMKLTFDENPITRKKALRELCPCQVKHDIEQFWNRILEMIHDPDASVRYQVLHNLCDGSPKVREEQVIAAIEDMHNDEDKTVRTTVHKVLTHYRRTGKWNIL
eukprot:TRINITY_DN3275_c0_g1_i1.p1 TRINITY_DN3275_c0_g1~~TRINITY_DN3275_c0_g1_i1.p1  ORF type:complete len:229 (-),score=47.50 TRINITY_DN3275_c0_g1_i1:106-792(-)